MNYLDLGCCPANPSFYFGIFAIIIMVGVIIASAIISILRNNNKNE